MEYELTDSGPCHKTIALKFSASDVDAAFDASYKEINGYVAIKGFRKGKAPRRALEKRFGKEAASGARQDLVEKNMPEIAEKEKLEVLGGFQSKELHMPEAGKEFALTLEFDVAPIFDLPEYSGLKLTEQKVDVAEEKVDETIERYRRMFANYEEVDDAAKEGDVLKVDFVAKSGDQEIMSMEEQRLRVDGDILFGLPCPDLVEKFTGAKKDGTVAVTVTLPEDHTNPELRGKPAEVIVTVKGVERGELPELNDAFAEGLGMGTMDAFRERIRSNLMREAIVESRQKQEDEIIDRLLDAVAFDVPEKMVESETAALVDQQRMRLSRAGAKQSVEMDQQLEKYRPEAAKQALKKVRWTMLSQKIAQKEGINVTNDDMAQQVEALAQSYNTSPAKIIQRIREFDGVAPMMAEILSIKVIQFIMDHAKGGRLDPARTDTDNESANAAAMQSAAGGDAAGEGEGCSCGHDHSHDHDH